MISKLKSAAKLLMRSLVWLPILLWMILSFFSTRLPEAHAFDMGINPMSIFPIITPSTETVICSSRTYIIDTRDQQINSLSVQVNYASAPVNTVSFNDGQASTATISVSSNSALLPTTSWITVTVTSNSALTGTTAYITIVISSNSALRNASLTLALSTQPFAIQYSTYALSRSTEANYPQITFSTQLAMLPGVITTPSSFTFTEGKEWSRVNFNPQANQVDLATMSAVTAISIANALNFSTYGITASTPNAFYPSYISTGSPNTVIVTARSFGKYANQFSLLSSTQFAMTVCYSTSPNVYPVGVATQTAQQQFIGGRDPTVLTLNTTGSFRLQAGKDFAVDPFVSGGASSTAQNIANAIQASSASWLVYATTANGGDFSPIITTGTASVFIRATVPGSFANSWTLRSSSQPALVVGISTASFAISTQTAAQSFQGGRDPVYLQFSFNPNLKFVAGINFAVDTAFSSVTALNISSAMQFHNQITTNVFIATATMYTTPSVIYMTSTYINHNEFFLFSSSQGALALSTGNVIDIGNQTFSTIPYVTRYSSGSYLGSGLTGASTATFQGGFASQIDTTSIVISTGFGKSPGYIFAQGQAVWFSTASGQTPPGRLVFGTTYYVMPSSNVPLAKGFTLSSTSTGALAGIPWTTGLSSSSLSGGGTFTLVPANWAAFTGSNDIKFHYSNDGINWFNVPSASVTVSAAGLQTGSTYYDFGLLGSNTNGRINYRYVRETVSASSTTPSRVGTTFYGKY